MKKKIWLISATSLLLLVGLAYLVFTSYYSSRFLPGTHLAGQDVSQIEVKAATAKVERVARNRQFVFEDQDRIVGQISARQLGLQHELARFVSQQMQTQQAWRFKHATGVQRNQVTQYDTKAASTFVNQLVANQNKRRRPAQDAMIVNGPKGFRLQKEVSGNQLDGALVRDRLSRVISTGKTRISLTGAYLKPAVTANSPKLQASFNRLKRIGQMTGVYRLAGRKITLSGQMIRSFWDDLDGKIQLNQDKLNQYVTQLNRRYATYNKTRTFKSTKRGNVKVPAGIYGWSLNVPAETVNLRQAILAGKSFDRTPLIQGSGYHADGTDIGSSYVEVDKQNQHMWVYLDGKLRLDTAVVTGKPHQATPSGVFYVWAKKRNEVLRGFNDDGSRYNSKVSYWMPIDTTGVGLHDSPWQPRYGGDWYLQHGSHGCVNTPPAIMKVLYQLVPTGTPVVVF
ncbi:MAG: L,D-transpeptidase family protein [Lactobacillus sp.]